MRHHTKDKGDIGVLKAAAWFAENGYAVLQPLTEHAPFDLVIYRSGLFWRVQVKYRTPSNGLLNLQFNTTWSDRRGVHHRPIDRREVDAMCVYDPTDGSCYFISPRAIAAVWASIRVQPCKNHQKKGVRSASECLVLRDEWAANWQDDGSFALSS